MMIMCTLDLCRYFGAQMELNYNIVTLYTKHLSFLFTYIHIYMIKDVYMKFTNVKDLFHVQFSYLKDLYMKSISRKS
jgi:hypothetical protein